MNEEKTLSIIPMLTRDGQPIRVGLILFRPSWSKRRVDDDREDIENWTLDPVRVFFVNNQARTFRVRCVEGCETIYKYADSRGSCPSSYLFLDIREAKKYLLKRAHVDLDEMNKKIDVYQGNKKLLIEDINMITELKEVPLPPNV